MWAFSDQSSISYGNSLAKLEKYKEAIECYDKA